MKKISELKKQFPTSGQVTWIGLRPQLDKPIRAVEQVEAIMGQGLAGDKAGQRSGGKRQVTLMQAEYLPFLQSLLANENISFASLRRNIAVAGINLNALKDQIIYVGKATLEISGFCHPCAKLEDRLGPGTFNALRGHGGLTAKVIAGGIIALGDEVRVRSVLD